jgi:hypothetical protein
LQASENCEKGESGSCARVILSRRLSHCPAALARGERITDTLTLLSGFSRKSTNSLAKADEKKNFSGFFVLSSEWNSHFMQETIDG